MHYMHRSLKKFISRINQPTYNYTPKSPSFGSAIREDLNKNNMISNHMHEHGSSCYLSQLAKESRSLTPTLSSSSPTSQSDI